MRKRNKITLIIEDVDPEHATVKFTSSFDTKPDIERGPQTPAELLAAKAMHFLQNYAMYEDRSNQPSIIMPEDYVGSDVNRAELIGDMIRADERKRH